MTRSGMNEASAPNTMSHTRCEISWLAYTTGAGYVAFTTVPPGASTSTGRHAPECLSPDVEMIIEAIRHESRTDRLDDGVRRSGILRW